MLSLLRSSPGQRRWFLPSIMFFCSAVGAVMLWLGSEANSLESVAPQPLFPRSLFARLAPPHYYFDEAYLDTLETMPAFPYQTNDTLAEVKLYITVRYLGPEARPLGMIMPEDTIFTPDSLRITPRFRLGNSLYLIRRPPGYDLSLVVCSTAKRIRTRQLYDIVAEALRKKLPLWYDPNEYLSPPGPDRSPRKRRTEHDLEPPQIVSLGIPE